MAKTYSLYEAKAKLSEIIRYVREHGGSVTISYHGRAVAEIRPVDSAPGDAVQQRVRELEESGELIRGRPNPVFRPGTKVAGGLQRFLAERD